MSAEEYVVLVCVPLANRSTVRDRAGTQWTLIARKLGCCSPHIPHRPSCTGVRNDLINCSRFIVFTFLFRFIGRGSWLSLNSHVRIVLS